MKLEELSSKGALVGALTYVSENPVPEAIRAFAIINGHEYCSECSMCKKARAGVHLDLYVSTKTEIAEARDLVKLMARVPNEVSKRLILIVGSRSVQFQNAMLKSLEEPTANTVIVWSVLDPASLIETVRSRCPTFYATRPKPKRAKPESISQAELFMTFVRSRDILAILDFDPEQELDFLLALSELLVRDEFFDPDMVEKLSTIAAARIMLRRRRKIIDLSLNLALALMGTEL